MPPACSPESRGMNGYPEETVYPSRTIAYQAAGMITSIIEALQMHDQLRYTPAFISNQTIVSATQQRLTTCMTALRDVSKVWLVAKMVHTLFESILGNKVLEERLQKAAGRKHNKHKQNGVSGGRTAKNTPPNERSPHASASEATKCKVDDMELGYVNGPPAAQMSYERSRPQSPAMTPSRDLPGQAQQGAQHHQIPAISATSPPVPHSTDAFMGTSRANTRPTTPFNAFSYPGTPPDLFLHTRGSPTISEDLWQNYDRGQLFPPEANGMGMGLLSPGEGMVDPALRQTPLHGHTPPGAGGMSMSDGNGQPMQPGQQHLPTYHHDPQGWAHLQANLHAPQHHDDQWSTGSSSGPVVRTTLNMGDWFEFFGIPNGDMNALGAGAGLANMVQQQHGNGEGGGGGYG
ncbi:Transcriptional activator of fatty acid utilization [Friedmanniomyces endolithicus]|uniref:Transcriptional activator of fatty acid utilization n=1 Tax=Rachicladosporium monterosium TaxID=1507873 RepID=A0ABR0LEI1_9PEZI|nr:Transcriptional activator of fatty acid utilization [Friedmanniomyces endolithicus]KAK5147602.1 Transcriptional activator of fatty acid utilization [Rachicladosporium monterosium]KAK0780829.1 Transcriptional activator of fatty acid utilization [Friedmanniomyces endolithicus]KAK0785130.1 Transcriptional activator of fatty acid utilization [Friedmanniomyces endolithicus]KAK0810697.1 Transcriptional activator of fatty acid utilization [Friedmanniomyces endolithicus]